LGLGHLLHSYCKRRLPREGGQRENKRPVGAHRRAAQHTFKTTHCLTAGQPLRLEPRGLGGERLAAPTKRA
jgi:hypothetical protein